MKNYKIESKEINNEDSYFQQCLANAYINKSRPMCLCKEHGVPMYIAKNNESYIIKRMPNSGQQHHYSCGSYEIPPELSGRGGVDEKAIFEDSNTGITSLRLDFSLSKVTTKREIDKGETKENKSIKSDPAKLTIRSLLHCLYEDAGLNKWVYEKDNKRNWFYVRKALLQAAQNKVSKKTIIAESLLIPETFFIDKKEDIYARRRRFLAHLKGAGSKKQMGILIGEVKNIDSTRFGYKMLIKHMPDTPLYMDEDIFKRIVKNFSQELTVFDEYEKTHLLTICTFYLSASGNPQIDSISFMLTDYHWLPFENIDEQVVMNKLISEKRSFIKGLRYNLLANDVIASFLLTDIHDNPTAMYIVPAGAEDDFYIKMDDVIKESGLSNYIWNLNNEDGLRIPEAKLT